MDQKKKKITIFTGAGISRESGIPTYRDADGLWLKYDPMVYATEKGLQDNFDGVMKFFNELRKKMKDYSPNSAHIGLAKLEELYDVQLITQNVDDLHERGGSKHVLHLHGNVTHVCNMKKKNSRYIGYSDCKKGDVCEDGIQLRPDVVLFGENVPLYQEAVKLSRFSDILIVIGTTLEVYPAAYIVENFRNRDNVQIFVIDPNIDLQLRLKGYKNLTFINKTATEGVEELLKILM